MNPIIIPAYKPNHLLLQLVDNLIAANFDKIIIINDGSGDGFSILFDELKNKGCVVIEHLVNLGKGKAIKTGIEYAFKTYQNINGYITCDADGQHQINDIVTVSKTLDENSTSLVLGSRDFSSPNVPKKSKMGNRFSSFYFKMTTGVTCLDTQTGLRGIPKSLTNLALSLKENRYDYEMTFLTMVAKYGYDILMVPITTVYLDSNASSHFRPIVDSIRIYREPLKFALSSLICAVIDIGVFTLLSNMLENTLLKVVIIATISARIISGITNFIFNKLIIFKNKSPIRRQFFRYFILYISQLTLSITFVSVLSFIPIHLSIIKVIVDLLLFVGSFFIQKNWVFKLRKHHI
ncbi:MAG: family 2 glycosyl transferase [Tenericutes bacterium HGW-Tenericutes-1]|jgi:putative flippase GtrA|nr:MAG: family 2 glycosyl transferase [Tenericutes bacterium HGW-Tenericutes-1]